MFGHGVSQSVNKALALSRDNPKVQVLAAIQSDFGQQIPTFYAVYSELRL